MTVSRPAAPADPASTSLTGGPGSGEAGTGLAQIEQNALRAPWHSGLADLAPVADELDVELIANLRRDSRSEQSMGRLGGDLGLDEAEPARDPVHVGVYRERIAVHREGENTRDRLGPHSGKRVEVIRGFLIGQLLEARQIERAFARLYLGEDRLDAACLHIGDTP